MYEIEGGVSFKNNVGIAVLKSCTWKEGISPTALESQPSLLSYTWCSGLWQISFLLFHHCLP